MLPWHRRRDLLLGRTPGAVAAPVEWRRQETRQVGDDVPQLVDELVHPHPPSTPVPAMLGPRPRPGTRKCGSAWLLPGRRAGGAGGWSASRLPTRNGTAMATEKPTVV